MLNQGNLASTGNREHGFFYGYIVVLALFIIVLVAYGLNYTFGVFFTPLIDEFGWSKATTSMAYSLSMLSSGFLGVFAGKLSDRFGPRVVGAACGLFCSLGFLLMSQFDALWQLYLFYGLLIAAGPGGVWPALVPSVAKWFESRRGFMTGIVASGIGFGQIILPPLVSRLIYTYDWRLAYIVLGAIAFVFIVAASQFVRRDPAQWGLLPYGRDKISSGSTFLRAKGLSLYKTVRTRQFWIVCIVYFCFGFSLHAVMVHIVPYAIELGIPAISAANFLAAIGGISIVAKIAMGVASDRFGIKPSLIFAIIVLSVALLWLLVARGLWALYLFTVIFGIGYGGTMALQPVVIADLFGLTSLGVILGTVSLAYASGGAVGPFFAGYIYDIQGSYQLSFLVCALISIICIILTVFLKMNAVERQVIKT